MDEIYKPNTLAYRKNLDQFSIWFSKKWKGNKEVENFLSYLKSLQTNETLPLIFNFFNLKKVSFVISENEERFSEMTGAMEVHDGVGVLSLAYKGKSKEKILEYLCHEVSHYLQQQDRFKNKWIDPRRPNDYQTMEEYENNNRQVSKEEARGSYKRTIEYEFDCNKRALELIRQFSLPLETTIVIPRMNAYHLFHYAALEHRSFYKDFDPADDRKVLKKVGDNLIDPSELESYYESGQFLRCFHEVSIMKLILQVLINLLMVSIFTLHARSLIFCKKMSLSDIFGYVVVLLLYFKNSDIKFSDWLKEVKSSISKFKIGLFLAYSSIFQLILAQKWEKN